MIYKYITTNDLKQVEEAQLEDLAKNFDALIIEMDLESFRKELKANLGLSKLYELFLGENKVIMVNENKLDLLNIEKYLKSNNVLAEKVLIVKYK